MSVQLEGPMMVRVLVPLLLAAVEVSNGGGVVWVKRSLAGRACAISPDVHALVYERGDGSELAYLDLETGRQKATLSNLGSEGMRLAISRDGKAVAILRERVQLSIWRPFDEPASFRTCEAQDFELPHVGDRSEAVYPVMNADPAFSPDGKRLAFAGNDFWWTTEPGQKGDRDAVGVLDLVRNKASAIPLPFATASRTVHHWYLAWSDDGETIWLAAHGQYQPERVERTGNMYVTHSVIPPNWTLYRCSIAEGQALPLARVPPSLIGLDGRGDLVVSDVDQERMDTGVFWWDRTAFGLIPVRELVARARGGAEAARVLALEAKTTKVVPAGGSDFRLEQVYIGVSHTCVVGYLNGQRVVLEEVPAPPQPNQ